MEILQQQRADMQQFIQSTVGATLEMVSKQQPKEMQVVVQQTIVPPAPGLISAPAAGGEYSMGDTGRVTTRPPSGLVNSTKQGAETTAPGATRPTDASESANYSEHYSENYEDSFEQSQSDINKSIAESVAAADDSDDPLAGLQRVPVKFGQTTQDSDDEVVEVEDNVVVDQSVSFAADSEIADEVVDAASNDISIGDDGQLDASFSIVERR